LASCFSSDRICDSLLDPVDVVVATDTNIACCTRAVIAYHRLTRFSGARYILSPALTPKAS
jgi:hypothetical protein